MGAGEGSMHLKRLAVACFALFYATFFGSAGAFAEELADVQKRIKDRNLKWVAERHLNPERKGLGLLRDGFTAAVPPAEGAGDVPTGLATAVDWRNIGADNAFGVAPGNYVSRVKNQGSCGSCWAFATTAILESATQIANNDPIEPLDPGSAYDLSEQVMLTCSGAGSCNGGYVTTASSYAATTGLLREFPSGCYAYNIGSTTCPNPGSYPDCDQTRFRIDAWSGVSATVDAMKNALNTHGPLVATYAVYNDFYRYYGSGIYEAISCDQTVNPLVGYHAVALVGYRDADAADPVGYFIVKNSWGAAWGESGYFRIAYSQVGNCVKFGGTTLAYSKTACNGAITVDSPAESATLQAGTMHAITWSDSGSIGPYASIDLYQAGNRVRTIQANALLADGSFSWLVDSDLQGPNFSVMVTSTACSSAYGTSGPFSINPAADFEVAGTAVSGSVGLSGVTISFSRVSGAGTIPAPVVTDFQGGWRQSGFQQGTEYRATPSKTGCTFSPAFLDFTDAASSLNFAATENKITSVISPTAGSIVKVGGALLVKWTYTGSPGPYVTIEAVNTATGARTAISSKAKIGTGGIGSYNWRIGKQQAAGTYRIKVASKTNGSSATSAEFSIIK
ncbi:dipeptidyl-peptidase I. Cysteine peptidase. MEROPS family C01A [Syntrophobacter fumaroxidans MPOB]|uniref:Dipeptidyl-peptidase I. Cysteine peptidase. MEROPS family C01A n=1 Tax=Syntrophobacter fumaroxidans (strain DSM 10017 / MPOB) TaxID=335543 RepID=A0LQG9_SYNFM|nr:dipeptidyl-peptidase I. Cysteine peptidase. MEROPS family C01A [Syntrophobacter fumaroxidans MPOB]